TTSNIGALTK
ncbi:hypothetical protein HKBW3S25_00109, partial [Candidatus Hakubella thermalkaliphila]